LKNYKAATVESAPFFLSFLNKVRIMARRFCTFLCCFIASAAALFAQNQSLKVTLIEDVPTEGIVAFYDKKDVGPGNTSLEFDSALQIKSSKVREGESFGFFNEKGEEIAYIKRNRDLGQTFRITGNTPKVLQSITVSTNHGTNAVRSDMYGQAMSVQLLEVSGTPKLNHNGTVNMEAYHGFPHDRNGSKIEPERDDYWEGEQYKTLAVIRGGKFPSKKAFGFEENELVSADHKNLKGRLIQCTFPESVPIVLQPNKTYAFLLIIDEIGENRGFALANNYYGSYEGGHGIRRDGSGKFPPIPYQIDLPIDAPANRKAVEDARFPSNFSERIKIQPGTNGYPDVDTYRDLFFFVIAK
jgi:hypothetical protein